MPRPHPKNGNGVRHANHPHHYSHDHEHNHHHQLPNPETRPLLFTQKETIAATFGNLAIGSAELIAGWGAKAMSAMADAIHNVGDAGSYLLEHLLLHKKNLSEKQRRGLLTTARAAIFGSSIFAGAKTVYDGVQETVTNSGLQLPELPEQIDRFAMSASAASLAFNGLLMAPALLRWRKTKRQHPGYTLTAAEKHAIDHRKYDMASAASAVAGTLTQPFIPFVDKAISLALNVMGAVHFRPWVKGHSHADEADCHEHDHSHDGHVHSDNHLHKKDGLYTRATRWLGAWSVALATPKSQKEAAVQHTETMAERCPFWKRKKVLVTGSAAVATLAAVAAWKLTNGAADPSLIPSGSDRTSFLPETSKLPSLSELPTPKPSAIIPAPPEIAPDVVTPPTYSTEARTVTQGEGLFSTFAQLNIPANQHAELLAKVGPELSSMAYADGTSISYLEDFNGLKPSEWRLRLGTGTLPTEALDVIKMRAA